MTSARTDATTIQISVAAFPSSMLDRWISRWHRKPNLDGSSLIQMGELRWLIGKLRIRLTQQPNEEYGKLWRSIKNLLKDCHKSIRGKCLQSDYCTRFISELLVQCHGLMLRLWKRERQFVRRRKRHKLEKVAYQRYRGKRSQDVFIQH